MNSTGKQPFPLSEAGDGSQKKAGFSAQISDGRAAF